MKLYVEERDMPPNCAECKAEGHYENSYGDEYGFFCPFDYKAYTSGTRDTKWLDNCPLVPIPPHGDLIDRGALKEEIWRRLCISKEGWLLPEENAIVFEILKAQTIIPADPAKEGE